MAKVSGQRRIYEMINNRIISLLEKGEIPWRKPWVSGGPGSVLDGDGAARGRGAAIGRLCGKGRHFHEHGTKGGTGTPGGGGARRSTRRLVDLL